MTRCRLAGLRLGQYIGRMHSEAHELVKGSGLATWHETAKVPLPHDAADAQLGHELNPTSSTAVHPLRGSSSRNGATAHVGFQLGHNHTEIGTRDTRTI